MPDEWFCAICGTVVPDDKLRDGDNLHPCSKCGGAAFMPVCDELREMRNILEDGYTPPK